MNDYELTEDERLSLFTKEVWQDLGWTGKGEYLASIADQVSMVPQDVSPEARNLRVEKMASRFEAGMPIFESDSLSTEDERLAALGEALVECIKDEPQPTGIRCPECGSRSWNCVFKSPVDPAGDRFVCQTGHLFLRYDGTRYGGLPPTFLTGKE